MLLVPGAVNLALGAEQFAAIGEQSVAQQSRCQPKRPSPRDKPQERRGEGRGEPVEEKRVGLVERLELGLPRRARWRLYSCVVCVCVCCVCGATEPHTAPRAHGLSACVALASAKRRTLD